jgi:protoheme IX farnesyltransferase
MPALIGWAGAAAQISRQACFLFAILFLWQFPHFLAIALLYRDDYARAGYRMLPQFDGDSRFTRAEIVGFTLILVITTMLLPVAGRGGPVYLTAMAAAGTFLLYHVANLARFTPKFLAGRVVHASVIYLPLILGIMVAWKRLMG